MNKLFEEIIDSGYRTIWKKGRYLFYRGDIGNDFYIIEKGTVELSIFDLNGEKMILSELRKGDFFGQIEIFTNGIRPTNAYVFPGTVLVGFSANIIRNYFLTHSRQAIELIEVLCKTIDEGIENTEDALVLNAYQKVSKKIYNLSQTLQSKHLYISQKRVGEFLALSEKTANASLQRLRDIGAICIRRSRIEILNDDILKNEFNSNKKEAA